MARALVWFLRITATLATLCLLLALAAIWYGYTEGALERAVAVAVARSDGRLQVDGVHGSALGPFSFARIAWKDGPLAIVAEDVQGRWSPRALLSRRLVIDELTVSRLTVSMGESSSPASPPDSLAIPLPISIQQLAIGSFELDSGGTVVGASQIELAYTGDDSVHRVRGLRLSSTFGSIDGDIEVGMQRPFPVSGRIDYARPDPRAAVAATIKLDGELARPALAIDATVGETALSGTATLLPFEPSWLPTLTLGARAVDLQRFDAAWPRTELTVAVNAATSGEGTISGSLEIGNAVPGTLTDHRLPVVGAQSAFRLEDRDVHLSGLRAVLAGGGTAEGSATLGSGRVELDLALTAVDLRAIHRPLRATRLAGTVRARIDGEGVNANASLRERDVRLALDLSQRGDRIDLKQFRAEARGGALAGSGRLTLRSPTPFVVNARAIHLNPAAFGDFAAASIDAAIDASGTLEPQWSADVRFRIDPASRLRGLPLTGDGRLLADASRVRDVAAKLQVASNTLQLHGALGQAGDKLDFAVDAPRLKEIDPVLEGKLAASGSVSGSFAAPAVSFDVRGSGLRAGEGYALASLKATGKVVAETNGQGQVDIAAAGLSTPQVDLATASLRLSGTIAEHQAAFAATGPQIDARFELKGSWLGGERREWRATVLSFEQHGDIPLMLSRPVTVEIARDGVELADLALTVSTGRVAVKSFRWRQHRLSSEGEFTGVPASVLMRLSKTGDNVHSTLVIGGEWLFTAAPRMNGVLRVRREGGDLESRDVAGPALGLTGLDIEARLDNDVLAATLSATSATLGTAKARLELTPPPGSETGALDRRAPAKLAATFDLASLKAIEVFTGTSAVVDGRLHADIEGSGTLLALKLTGRFDGDDLRIDAPQYGIAVRNGRLRAELRDDELRVSELELGGGDGKFTATGTMPLRSEGASTVRWTAEKFALLNRPDARLVLGGSGALIWESGRISLKGSLSADEGHFEFAASDTTSLSDDVVVKGREAAAFEARRRLLTKVPLKLDLELDLGPRLTVVGYGFDARLEGRVKVVTTDDGTLLAQGRVTAINGTYLAFGQKLALERGRIFFDGPIDNPGLDVLAVRRNLPVEVGIAITGTARAPRAQVTSNPSMPDGEKLSWLVLGHGTDRTSGNENAVLQSAAALLFQSTFSTSGTSTIASAVGLDDISVHARASGVEGQVLSFGKRLADNLYVAFDQGLNVTSTAVRVEYTLTRSWMLRAEAGVISSFGLYYTRSFR